MPKGGRRAGAGAPRGNKNAFRHGRRMGDARLRTVWSSLTPEQQEIFLPLIRKHGADIPGIDELSEAGQSKVIPIDSRPSPREPSRARVNYTPTHSDTQSNNQRQGVVAGLTAFGFFGADRFVTQHIEALGVIQELLEEFRQVEEDDPNALVGLQSKSALLRSQIHSAIAYRTGRLWQCPHCPWMQFRLIPEERTS